MKQSPQSKVKSEWCLGRVIGWRESEGAAWLGSLKVPVFPVSWPPIPTAACQHHVSFLGTCSPGKERTQ